MKLSKREIKWIEIGLVAILIVLGSFLRIYRLRETLIFQGDQGRDALIVKRLIKDGNLTLLGPVTSVGNMYLGPFYYYFMAPFLALSYPDPSGPAYGVAIVNILLLIILYLMTKEMFGKMAGIITLFIYTLMVPAITLSRFSWNPNLAPFVSTLIIWGLYRVWIKRQYRKLIGIGFGLGILAQLHYITMIMLGVSVVIFVTIYLKEPENRKELLKMGMAAIFIFILTWLPLIMFNARHNNLIFQSFNQFIFSPEQHLFPGGSILRTIRETDGKFIRLLGQTIAMGGEIVNRLIGYVGLLFLLLLAFLSRGKIFHDKALIIILVILCFSVIGVSVYSGSIFDHYLGFVLPALAVYWGYVLTQIWRRVKYIGPVSVSLLLATYFIWIVPKAPVWAEPGPPLNRYAQTANDIASQIGDEKYNIALLSESKDYQGMNYRYFLATTAKPPAETDDYNNLDKLIVIDELGVMDPLQVKIFEIQEPKLSVLVNQFTSVKDVKIYIYGKGKRENNVN